MVTFPQPTLTRITSRPTYRSLLKLRRELYANARAIESHRGGGRHGHLALLMHPAAFALISGGQSFDLPAHPGEAPEPATTAAGITEATRVYKSILAERDIAALVTNSLRQQLLEAVDHSYIAVLEDGDFGFSDVALPTFLDHLFNCFGEITPTDLIANRERILTAWNIDNPIQMLWAEINDIKRFAAAGLEPISDTSLIGHTIIMFERTGVFQASLDAWRHRPTSDRTWANFVTYFTTEDNERLRRLTASQAGFQSAHSVGPPPGYSLPPPSVANTSITTLTSPSLAAMAISGALARPPPPTNSTSHGTTMYYCWTHGFGRNHTHTSATCRAPADGHCPSATFANTMGGNTRMYVSPTRDARRPNGRATHPSNPGQPSLG